jgi:hypothetical protein
MRSVDRIELPPTEQEMIWVRRPRLRRFIGMALRSKVYNVIYIGGFVNKDIYMDFKEATDELCAQIDHQAVAKALGVSTQTVRQARMSPEAGAHRSPPGDWEYAVIRLAEERVWHYRNLIERLRSNPRESEI